MGKHITMLNEVLAPYLDNMPPATLQHFWFQQHGTPPHFALTVRQWLNARIPGKWINYHGPIRWPPWSPDLSPLGSSLWGHLKSAVYAKHGKQMRHWKNVLQRNVTKLVQINCMQLLKVKSIDFITAKHSTYCSLTPATISLWFQNFVKLLCLITQGIKQSQVVAEFMQLDSSFSLWSLGFNPCDFTWESWCTKWHWSMFLSF